MPSSIRWIPCVIACFALTGCAGNDMIVKRQAEAEAKLEHLIQADKRSGQRLNEFSGQVLSLEDQLKDSTVQIKQLQTTIQELGSMQEELKVRLALLAQQAVPKVEVVNPVAPPKGKDSGPPPEYVKAFGLYSANNFKAAIQAFEIFLQNSPNSDFAANATYWIGECYYSLSDLPKALESFQKGVDEYPKSAKVPDALLKLGYTQAALNERDKATATFERLIKSYPGSLAASKARERLTAH